MSTPIKTADVIERLRNAAQEAYEKLVTVEDGFGQAEVDAEDLETICGVCEMLTRENERFKEALRSIGVYASDTLSGIGQRTEVQP